MERDGIGSWAPVAFRERGDRFGGARFARFREDLIREPETGSQMAQEGPKECLNDMEEEENAQ